MRSKKQIEKVCKYVDCGKTFYTVINKKQFCSTKCQQNNKAYNKSGKIPEERPKNIPKYFLVRGKPSLTGARGMISYNN